MSGIENKTDVMWKKEGDKSALPYRTFPPKKPKAKDPPTFSATTKSCKGKPEKKLKMNQCSRQNQGIHMESSGSSLLNVHAVPAMEFVCGAPREPIILHHNKTPGLDPCEFWEPPTCGAWNTSSRRVTFQDMVAEYATNFQDKEECKPLWYTQEDLKRFKKATHRTIFSLRKSVAKEGDCWFHAFQEIFRDFCKPLSCKGAFERIRAKAYRDVNYCDSYLGLERKVMAGIIYEQTHRKDCLYSQVNGWQSVDLLNDECKQQLIHKVSCELSQPSIRLAFYIANVVAFSEAKNS